MTGKVHGSLYEWMNEWKVYSLKSKNYYKWEHAGLQFINFNNGMHVYVYELVMHNRSASCLSI